MCIPVVNRTISQNMPKLVPWWDEQCKEAVYNSKLALNLYRQDSTLYNYIIYKKADSKKKKLILEKKKNGWRNLCHSFNRYTPVGIIWNFIRRFKRITSQSRSKNDEWIPSFLDKFAPLMPPQQQFGFRKGRSAVESFTSFIADIRNSFFSHSATVGAFLDVQGAFDNVTPSILIQVLSKIKIPGKICKFVFNFLY